MKTRKLKKTKRRNARSVQEATDIVLANIWTEKTKHALDAIAPRLSSELVKRRKKGKAVASEAAPSEPSLKTKKRKVVVPEAEMPEPCPKQTRR